MCSILSQQGPAPHSPHPPTAAPSVSTGGSFFPGDPVRQAGQRGRRWKLRFSPAKGQRGQNPAGHGPSRWQTLIGLRGPSELVRRWAPMTPSSQGMPGVKQTHETEARTGRSGPPCPAWPFRSVLLPTAPALPCCWRLAVQCPWPGTEQGSRQQ